MANDMRYPAAVSRNLVRALRKVAAGYNRLPSTPADWTVANALTALADELEASTEGEGE